MERKLNENEALWSLMEAITEIRDVRKCAMFFRDLCTLSELQAMAERWQVVRLVDQGIPYRQISEMTGASTATITRVAHWLRHGEGGYQEALEKLKEKKEPAED